MQSKGNYVGVDKRIVHWLPRVGPFTKVEALVSLTIDLDDIIYKTATIPETAKDAIFLLLSHKSVDAYAKRWDWTWPRTNRFIRNFTIEALSKRLQNVDSVPLIFRDLEHIPSRQSLQYVDVFKKKNKKERNDALGFQPVLEFYLRKAQESKGFRPELPEKDFAILSRRLKEMGEDRVRSLILFFLDSEKSDKHISLSAALSADTLNLYRLAWKKVRFQYPDDAEIPTGQEIWWT